MALRGTASLFRDGASSPSGVTNVEDELIRVLRRTLMVRLKNKMNVHLSNPHVGRP